MIKYIQTICLLFIALGIFAQTRPDLQPSVTDPNGNDAFYSQERGSLLKYRLDTLLRYFTPDINTVAKTYTPGVDAIPAVDRFSIILAADGNYYYIDKDEDYVQLGGGSGGGATISNIAFDGTTLTITEDGVDFTQNITTVNADLSVSDGADPSIQINSGNSIQIIGGTNTDVTGNAAAGEITVTSTATGGSSLWTENGADIYRNSQIGLNVTAPVAAIDLVATAISGRENLIKAKVSDNALNQFGVGNGTTGSSNFLPTFFAYNASNSSTPFIFRSLTNSGNGTSGDFMFNFQASTTSSSSDPLNGTFGSISRDLFRIRNHTFSAFELYNNGEFAFAGQRFNIIGATNGDQLVYNSGSNSWEAQSGAGSGDDLGDHVMDQDLITAFFRIRHAVASGAVLSLTTGSANIQPTGSLSAQYIFNDNSFTIPTAATAPTTGLSGHNITYFFQEDEFGLTKTREYVRKIGDFTSGGTGSVEVDKYLMESDYYRKNKVIETTIDNITTTADFAANIAGLTFNGIPAGRYRYTATIYHSKDAASSTARSDFEFTLVGSVDNTNTRWLVEGEPIMTAVRGSTGVYTGTAYPSTAVYATTIKLDVEFTASGGQIIPEIEGEITSGAHDFINVHENSWATLERLD